MVTGKYYEGVGRRKSAVARVRLFAGSGAFMVHEKPVND
jgi:ribosomal protein S9